MKHNMKLLLVFLLSMCVAVKINAQDLSTPVGYLAATSTAQQEMDKTYMAYMSAVGHGKKARKVEKLRQKVVEASLMQRTTQMA